MLDRSRKGIGSVMATSETLLTVVAVRLAALVVAGLVAKIAAADHLQQGITCVPDRAVVRVQATPAVKPEADEKLRDMLLHD
jgi:hypothetical protein